MRALRATSSSVRPRWTRSSRSRRRTRRSTSFSSSSLPAWQIDWQIAVPARQAGGMNETKAHWEEHYGERDRVWTGRVNVQFADVAADLPPGGRSISAAVRVATRCGSPNGAGTSSRSTSPRPRWVGPGAASSRGVGDRIEFVELDLSDGFPDGTFDLISAQFLHSTVRLDRTRILANAAAAVRPGGLLVIVDHGSAPPWASKLDHHHEFPSAEEVVAGLDLSDDEFERVRVEPSRGWPSAPTAQQRRGWTTSSFCVATGRLRREEHLPTRGIAPQCRRTSRP